LFLRILLEFYRREKKIRILLFKRLLDEEPKEHFNLKGSIHFHAFRRVMEQYDPSMNELEVSRLYREAYVAGNGTVGFESLVLVMNEQNFFVRTM
jgi:Ca2+-binding EF-hand superfamily protein